MATPSAGELPPVAEPGSGEAAASGRRAAGSRPAPFIGRAIARAWPGLLLFALTVTFFWKIALTGQVLVGYDTFAYFYPYLQAASSALREFRLPLWNPDVFMGAPLAANLQTALFYPTTLLYLLIPTTFALSADIILHTFLAAAFTYLLARQSLDASPLAALTAAVAFGFSGFFAAQAGHVNQVRAAVWLPLLLLFFDRALQGRGLVYVLATGAAIGLTLLAGHSQEAYMILCALGGYFVWNSAGATRRALNLGRPPGRTLWQSTALAARMLASAAAANARGVAILAGAVSLGLALAAVQLLPSLELARLSVRAGGMAYRQAVSFSLSPLILPEALLPGYWQNPFSEYVGYLGVAGLVLAAVGAWNTWRDRRAGFFAALAAMGLVLALGGYTPVYIFGYALVPGFGLFRVPARWLFLYTFGMAMLAGLGMHCLEARIRQPRPDARREGIAPARGARRSLWAAMPAWAAAAPLGLGALALWAAHAFQLPPVLVWLAVGGCTVWLARAATRALSAHGARFGLWTLLALLVVELFAASRGMEYNHPAPPEAVTALRPALAHLLTDDSDYRILSLSLGLFDPGDLADMRQMVPKDTAADFATASKNKEILAPNTPMLFGIESMDGYDGGILPLQRYVELQQLFLNPWQVSVDGRLREHLTEIPEERLLSLLNVKYVLTDKVRDVWVDNVYYDLGNSVAVSPTLPAWTARDLPPFPAGEIGIASYLQGAAAIADGAAVASVTVTDTAGNVEMYVLRAGRDTAETAYADGAAAPAHKQARVVATWRENPPGSVYLATLTLRRPQTPASIEIRYTAAAGQLVIKGISLVDPRTGASQALAISQVGALRLVHGGDVKLYENTQVLPRAFVVHRAQVLQTNRAVLDTLKDPSFRPDLSAVFVADGLDVTPLRSMVASQPDAVSILGREPERVEIAAKMGGNGLLVLTDMWYPGWRAYVDGVETSIYRVYHAFRGVYVPAGEHRVEFVYDGAIWRWGGLITLATALALWFVMWRGIRGGDRKGAAAAPRPDTPSQKTERSPDL